MNTIRTNVINLNVINLNAVSSPENTAGGSSHERGYYITADSKKYLTADGKYYLLK